MTGPEISKENTMSSTIRYADQNITEIKLAEVPREVPIIPLRNAVVLPGVLLPIFVGRAESVELIEKAGKPGDLVGLFSQKEASQEKVDGKGLFRTGTLGEIHRIVPMSEGGYQVFLQGIQKIELLEIRKSQPYLIGRINALGELNDVSDEKFNAFKEKVYRYIKTHPGIPDEATKFVKRLTNPSSLANMIVFFSEKEIAEKIEFLQISSLSEKIDSIEAWLVDQTNHIQTEREVREKVEKDAEKMQRDFYLRKQLEQIRKELGEDEDAEDDDLEKQLAEKWLPEHVRKAVNKELKRLHRLGDAPGGGAGIETGQIRSWLELVLDLPWEDPAPSEINLKEAARILDEDHEGLQEIKKQILEYLAVEKQTGGARAPILCLVGPPGVGKTSLARSVARALGRTFVRSALGGVRDESEIRGHRRTYVGSLPGKILSSMKKAERRDPVFLLDEVDKTGASYQGDPAAALLEVLDPEQNHTFEDHYLGLEYDLSRVLFIATANQLDTIPLALLDRMEVVNLSGYTVEEKKAIARHHLVPEILEQLKLEAGQIEFTDGALEKVIQNHTREAGVRSLKRKLETIARKAIRVFIEKREEKSGTEGTAEDRSPFPRVVYDEDRVQGALGRDRYTRDLKELLHIPGVAIGLAWTPVGGDILYIEATAYTGKGELKLSGQLGDVMKESAHAALSFIKSYAREMNIDPEVFREKDIHIHIPSGSIPKDGPSAGVTLLTALVSLFTGKPVAGDLAMTGEISLRGRILPVGGIKEKVLGARAAGIRRVFLPEKNRPDFEEIPEHVREGIETHYFSEMRSLIQETVPGAFEKSAAPASTREGW